MRARFTYIVFLVLLSAAAVSGQRPALRIAGLEGDERYGALTSRLDTLSAREESVGARIKQIRKLFADNAPGKENYSDELILLEIELYKLRDTISIVARDISAVEQEWVIRNMRSGNAGEDRPAVNGGTPYLVRNDFFREALPPEEYRQLFSVQEMEREAGRIMGSIKDNYDRMRAVDSVYRNAAREQADSLYASLSGLAAENEGLAGWMSEVWDEVFDTKIYLYNYILDSEGMTDTMAEAERLMSDMNLRVGETRGRYMYDAVAAYPFQKSLLLRYETALATYAGLHRAVDSLRNAASEVAAPEGYLLPVIDTSERLFLDYAGIAVAKPPVYNTSNPIPATEIYAKGTIYRILLGVYSKPQAVSLFRGVFPLSVERKDDTKYYYYAGGFPSHEEAAGAADELKKLGFGNPRIVAWYDGVYHDTSDASKTLQRTVEASVKYRVEITGAADGLGEQVRAAIEEAAPGKEISKVTGQDGVSPVFVVGSFDDTATARSVADAIIAADPSLGTTVVQLTVNSDQ